MIGVQEILPREADGSAPPEIFSTHPSAPNRIETIEAAIAEVYPGSRTRSLRCSSPDEKLPSTGETPMVTTAGEEPAAPGTRVCK
jgi:predicted Zn-dependent protease